MEEYLIISANGSWYNLFYNLAFSISLVILIFEGYHRKIPMLKWIFLLVITRSLFIIGTKVFTFSSEEWTILFTRLELPETTGKSLIGGLLFGGVGLLVGYYLLRFKQNIADAFAIVLPIGIAIQRVGCFLTGCCFGRACYLPWAVKYPVHTLPHYHQFNDNLLTYNDFLSLPVHPVQLYEMIGLLAVVFILFSYRKRVKKMGSLFIVSLILIFIVRVSTEFFRDVNAHTIGGEMFWILNTTQRFLLPLILFLIYILVKREKSTVGKKPSLPDDDLGIAPAFLLLLSLTLGLQLFKNWFSLPELAAIEMVFLLAIIVIGYRIISRIYISPYRWVYFTGFILPLFLMAQTFPAKQDSVTIKKYRTIKIGMGKGDYDNSHNIGQGEGCDRISQTEYFQQKYTLAGAGFELTEVYPEKKQLFRYGIKTVFGNHEETRWSDNDVKNTTLFWITPYAVYETKWMGIGGGLHVGNLVYITENLSVDGNDYPETGSKNTFVYPKLYLRFGPQRWFFLDYHLADNFPSALPGYRHQFGIGTGLGMVNGTNLRMGIIKSNTFYYLSGYFPINNKIVLEPTFLWGKSSLPNMYSETNYQFSIGIGYRFGFSEVKKKNNYRMIRGSEK